MTERITDEMSTAAMDIKVGVEALMAQAQRMIIENDKLRTRVRELEGVADSCRERWANVLELYHTLRDAALAVFDAPTGSDIQVAQRNLYSIVKRTDGGGDE